MKTLALTFVAFFSVSAAFANQGKLNCSIDKVSIEMTDEHDGDQIYSGSVDFDGESSVFFVMDGLNVAVYTNKDFEKLGMRDDLKNKAVFIVSYDSYPKELMLSQGVFKNEIFRGLDEIQHHSINRYKNNELFSGNYDVGYQFNCSVKLDNNL